jgi:sigma-E factor negative regulatory protein RseC
LLRSIRVGEDDRFLAANWINGMREQGIVTRAIPPNAVEVSLKASEACGRCGACHPHTEGRVSIEAAAINGLKAGDAVELEISTGGVLAASFIVYLLPGVCLIAGYVIGSALGGLFSIRVSDERGGIAGAILLFAASFWVVRRYDQAARRRKTPQAKVIRILPEGGEPMNIDAVSM